MNHFEYDAIQKKRIARGIHSMKLGGSATALTPAPYTNKEIQAMNGPVYTLQYKKPMTFAEFNFLPNDLQKEYLLKIMEKFDIRLGQVGYMFGRSNDSMSQLNKRKWHIEVFRGGDLKTAQHKVFKTWVDAGGDPEPESEPEVSVEPVKQESIKPVIVEMPKEETKKAPHMNFTLDDTMTFMELGQYLAPMAALYGKDARIHFRVVMSNE